MYAIKVLAKGGWWFLAGVGPNSVRLTPRPQEAERFASELDAKTAAVYLPDGVTWQVVTVG